MHQVEGRRGFDEGSSGLQLETSEHQSRGAGEPHQSQTLNVPETLSGRNVQKRVEFSAYYSRGIDPRNGFNRVLPDDSNERGEALAQDNTSPTTASPSVSCGPKGRNRHIVRRVMGRDGKRILEFRGRRGSF